MNRCPTVSVASHRLADGSLTSESLVAACLERIDRRAGATKAWAYLDPDAALEQARLRDTQERRSPIHGVPVGIKDVFDTARMPTAYGAAPFEGHRPALDAAVVGMLRQAGAVILGKTKTTEFATFYPSDAANPVNPAHTPGGSSSGSAAAVADGQVPAALGTQTMGSVIRPAAYCGAVGYKPSFGSLSRAGLALLSETNDTIGLFTRAVADLPMMMAAMLGLEPESCLAEAAGAPGIGLFRGPDADLALPEASEALAVAERAFSSAGAAIREIDCPPVLMRALPAHMTITLFELARSLAAVLHDHADGLSDKLKEMIADGAAISLAQYHEALDVAGRAREAVAHIFGEVDILLTYAAPGEAPEGLGNTGDPIFNRLWSLLGGPCVTLPVMKGPKGLPVGVQLVGPVRQDPVTLAHALWAEQVLADRA